jgi:flavin reductase (DIM6/NTAB) family NADH-FMN oxidoreductase RutF
MFSIGNALAGRQKGTHRNLTARPEFVISLASSSQAKSVQETSAELPFEVSEVKKYDIQLADWSWSIPRVRDAPVSLGCVARQFTQVGATEQIAVFAEIGRTWAKDDVGRLDGAGRLLIDVKTFDPLARAGKGPTPASRTPSGREIRHGHSPVPGVRHRDPGFRRRQWSALLQKLK